MKDPNILVDKAREVIKGKRRKEKNEGEKILKYQKRKITVYKDSNIPTYQIFLPSPKWQLTYSFFPIMIHPPKSKFGRLQMLNIIEYTSADYTEQYAFFFFT